MITKKFFKAGLEEMYSSPCILKYNNTIVVCYVNDLLVTVKTENIINKLKANLESKLVLKDLGKPTLFLGLQLTRSTDSFLLIQEMLVENLLIDAGMFYPKAVNSPTAVGGNPLMKKTNC